MAVATYEQVEWEDYPSTNTPVSATNLNKMDAGIKENNDAIKVLEESFTSVSNGKASIASAITGKGVTTASDATFATMAENISNIPNANSETYTVSQGGTIDMGATNSYRYLSVNSGVVKIQTVSASGTIGSKSSVTATFNLSGFTDASRMAIVNYKSLTGDSGWAMPTGAPTITTSKVTIPLHNNWGDGSVTYNKSITVIQFGAVDCKKVAYSTASTTLSANATGTATYSLSGFSNASKMAVLFQGDLEGMGGAMVETSLLSVTTSKVTVSIKNTWGDGSQTYKQWICLAEFN